jgi:hypothetical protein
MPNLAYLLPRVMRHFLPENGARFLLHRGILIKSGLETRLPEQASERYRTTLAAHGLDLAGKRVLLFGYGGGLGVACHLLRAGAGHVGVACHLLRAGAGHVVLAEKGGEPLHRQNRALGPLFPQYLELRGDTVWPRPGTMTLRNGDIRQAELAPVDLVLSSSVYEHLEDVEGITRALARETVPGGTHLHFVDLRDHFFRYPFEMLCYSEAAWRSWLNPTSNHNRCRLGDYQRVFAESFEQVEIEVLERDPAAFARARARILPQFLTGDPQVDSVTQIYVLARKSNHEIHERK